jgi:CelD/BcsL family acetyltransferase involved in cellulose biosynthesis
MSLEPQHMYLPRDLARGARPENPLRVVPLSSDASASRAPLRLETHVITDEPDFDRLADEWDQLLDNSAQRVYFLRQSWGRSWWRNLAPKGATLHIVSCRDGGGRLLGIAPLYRRRHRVLGIPYLRELVLIGTGIEFKSSEYLDVIAHRGHERAVAEAIADCLQRRQDWDRIWMYQVPSESPMWPHLVNAFGSRKSRVAGESAAYIDTSVSWEDYKRSLGRSMRRNVEYYARRLFKTHECEFRRIDSRPEALAALTILARLHQSRWRAAGHPGVFGAPTVSSLLEDAVREEFDADRIRLWTLSIDGEVQGALIGFLDNHVLHYFQKGFNPNFTKEDLGTALLSLCVRDCFEDPKIHAFDFMSGGGQYKKLWAREERTTETFVFEQVNLRARLHGWLGSLREGTTKVYRLLAPTWLRDARRDLYQRIRFERSDR